MSRLLSLSVYIYIYMNVSICIYPRPHGGDGGPTQCGRPATQAPQRAALGQAINNM